MYNKQSFANSLKKILDDHGITQRDFADRMNTTDATMSRYTTGKRYPDLETFVSIAHELNVSLDELAGVEPPRKPRQAPDVAILVSCYQLASDRDRKIIWSVFEPYMSAQQRIVVDSVMASEKEAV